MKLNRKVASAALLASLVVVVAGCGGINTSQHVSPSTFLLPGLLQADPPPVDPAAPVPVAVSPVQVAQLK